MATSKGDKKAQKAKAKGKSDKPSRRPKQKGKVKKALSARPKESFRMRTHLPADMKVEEEANRLLDSGVSTVTAWSIASWRVKHKVA